MSDRMNVALDAWTEAPEWIIALVRACDETSQNKVAQRVGITASTVSQAIRKSYKGNLNNIEARVRAVYLSGDVACPALGSITGEVCMKWRDKSRVLQSSTPNRVRMFRACRRCPLNPINDEDAS